MGNKSSRNYDNTSDTSNLPTYARPEFWPSSDDTIEELKEKVELNLDTALGEIGHDIIFPNRDSDVTEYQSNALRARQLIEEKENEEK